MSSVALSRPFKLFRHLIRIQIHERQSGLVPVGKRGFRLEAFVVHDWVAFVVGILHIEGINFQL